MVCLFESLMLRYLALGLWMAFPGAATAFGDCSTPEYMSRFIRSGSAVGIECVELARQEVMTADGPRTIRAIADLNVGWAVPASVLEAVRQAISGVAEALPLFGGLRMDDVTILILDDVYSLEAPDPEIGEILGLAGPPIESECLVTVYGLAAEAADPMQTATTTAHEIFHCVQYASFGEALPASYGSGGDWWVEGSAEYFAGVAVRAPSGYTDRSAVFDASVTAGVAINDMSYEASTFFYWLHQTQGAPAVRQLLETMPATAGATAQQAAMRAALPDSDWLAFVQAYADKSIQHPQGEPLHAAPVFQRQIVVMAPGRQEFRALPFVPILGNMHYDCGVWGQSFAPEVPWGQRPTGATGWEVFPEELDARTESGRPDWEFVAIATHSGAGAATQTFERRRSCRPCGGTDSVDACVVGTWQLTSGGPEDWMRSQGLPFNAAVAGPRIVTYRSDGAYGTEPFGMTVTANNDGVLFEGEGHVTYGFGRWTAEDGKLAICQDAGGMSGTVTVTTSDGQTTRAVVRAGEGDLAMGYSCSDGQMTTIMEFPRGLPDMVTVYSKIAD